MSHELHRYVLVLNYDLVIDDDSADLEEGRYEAIHEYAGIGPEVYSEPQLQPCQYEVMQMYMIMHCGGFLLKYTLGHCLPSLLRYYTIGSYYFLMGIYEVHYHSLSSGQ